ncbi:MAG: cytochrome c oxidase subunit II [Ignavibacteriae bacterium]|nr:cytochrome c oxidase subunit II [Ignavibacteriota bacterium]NOG99147.1 cytochrome c oxidase subunit II [Ignavibacteriota bacterium]
MLFSQIASRNTQMVDDIMWYIVGISVVLLVGITITMIYFVFKYNRKKGHKPVDIHGNIWLEIVWIGIPTILVLTMFFYSYSGYKILRTVPDDAFEINVKARMWEWEFNYENGKKTDTLFVPVNKPILLTMESMDVNHSFFIPAFRIKEDVFAGKETYLTFTPEKVDNYDIACAEYCGLNHSMMYSEVVVMQKDKFTEWYGENIDENIIDENTKAEISN